MEINQRVRLTWRRRPGNSTPSSRRSYGHRVDTGGDDRLDDQLTAQFKLWLRDETKGLTLDDAKKPMLSRIFLWYAGDFESRGGSPQYAARYAPPGAAKDALATTSPSYFAYDWHLNTQ